MVAKKSLFNPSDLEEIKFRISKITSQSERKWGKMNVAQMFRHCDKILQIGLGKIILPKIFPGIKWIGMFTKFEMKIFNNGIPPNMPTFAQVITSENCNFEKSKEQLLATLDEFVAKGLKNNLLSEHPLFGKMSQQDWGFMEYKHLHHHLKQFGV
ncbi:DUF1569 domain-containing protein [Kaistella montana]|uniref:DUF1569 domain-containing protein n=1 Tax=Kaistella montana TaxID=1849733 RepID=A0ABW5K7N1_9FLAO|nr:DUF1569 domain-containing protein [Kaistella montana]MCQ4034749.1 DUF1569 domain-containing protein [Kaistella montana]